MWYRFYWGLKMKRVHCCAHAFRRMPIVTIKIYFRFSPAALKLDERFFWTYIEKIFNRFGISYYVILFLISNGSIITSFVFPLIFNLTLYTTHDQNMWFPNLKTMSYKIYFLRKNYGSILFKKIRYTSLNMFGTPQVYNSLSAEYISTNGNDRTSSTETYLQV